MAMIAIFVQLIFITLHALISAFIKYSFQVAVSVKDYGIGIDKNEHQKIFERFYRVEGKNEHIFSGFGIGLFIANTIIERHNGLITIESEQGKGSVFTFTLPIISENNL